MKARPSVPVLLLLILVGGLGSVYSQTFDISSGGTPTITGALGGSIGGSSSVLNNLSVTINFGEISPANTSNLVKVVIPIAVRSDRRYQVTATVNSFSTGASAQAVQRADIGFGVRNFRSMGANARVCTASPHILYSPFSNDPASAVSLGPDGRATYPSTINNIVASTVILSGPRLSSDVTPVRQTNNGYIFDAILVVTPQFYATGTTSATVTFTISLGPNAPC